jgi:hypothetical protein
MHAQAVDVVGGLDGSDRPVHERRGAQAERARSRVRAEGEPDVRRVSWHRRHREPWPSTRTCRGPAPDYIEHALRAYRSGQRKNAVMAGMASALTDEDIDELADYYGRQQPGLCSTKDIREVGKCAGH